VGGGAKALTKLLQNQVLDEKKCPDAVRKMIQLYVTCTFSNAKTTDIVVVEIK